MNKQRLQELAGIPIKGYNKHLVEDDNEMVARRQDPQYADLGDDEDTSDQEEVNQNDAEESTESPDLDQVRSQITRIVQDEEKVEQIMAVVSGLVDQEGDEEMDVDQEGDEKDEFGQPGKAGGHDWGRAKKGLEQQERIQTYGPRG